jgi:hypothetical protein
VSLRPARLAGHLLEELRAHGALKPFRKIGALPYTAAIRAVPDRKDPRLARVILPCLQLNDAMRRPPLPPTPYIRVFIQATLNRKWMGACDFIGWFWTLQCAESVARRFFAVYTGRFEALSRGLLGWCWMPYIMASLAQLIACVAACDASHSRDVEWAQPSWLARPGLCPFGQPLGSTAFAPLPLPCGPGAVQVPTCIDNVTVSGDDPAEVSNTLLAIRARARALGVEIHDVQGVTQQAVSLGIEFALGANPRFRIARPWARKWITRAADADGRSHLSVRTFWQLVGGAVYVAYAEGYPFSWLRGAIERIREVAAAWTAGRTTLVSPMPYDGAARNCVRAVATQLCAGTWRRMATQVGRPVFSDAAVRNGVRSFGAVVPRAGGYVAFASGTAPSDLHINVLEARAAVWAARRAPAQPGLAVPRVLDSTSAAYWIYRGAARSRVADAAIRDLYELAAARGEGWGPALWVPSAAMPADAPSRLAFPACYRVQSPCAPPTQQALIAHPAVVAELPAGWSHPVSLAEFRSATASCASEA